MQPHIGWAKTEPGGKEGVFIGKGPAKGRRGTSWEFKSHQNLLSTYYMAGSAVALGIAQ